MLCFTLLRFASPSFFHRRRIADVGYFLGQSLRLGLFRIEFDLRLLRAEVDYGLTCAGLLQQQFFHRERTTGTGHAFYFQHGRVNVTRPDGVRQ